LARKGIEMFMRNWRDDGGVYENYNAETGQGGDVWNAARFYHWGGLLVLIAIQELIDAEPTGYLRFGSVQFPNAGVRNVRVGGDVYDVELHDGLTVSRNGRRFLDSSGRAIVRVPFGARAGEPIEISAATPGRLTLHAPGEAPCPIRLDDRTIPPVSGGEAGALYCW
jgi:hypothetical protein